MRMRFALAIAGATTACLTLASATFGTTAMLALLMIGTLLLFVSGELVERHLYFTAEASLGMPGT
jgi:hypothetical protein